MNESPQFDAARQARRITEQAVSWYIEQQEPLSERQRVAFLNWLRTSPRHVAEYFAVAQMHGDFKVAAMLKQMSADELVEQAGRDNLVMFPLMGDAIRKERTPRPGRMRRAVAAVAGIAAMVAIACLGFVYWRSSNGMLEQSYAGNATTVRTLTLPDGTLVQLDRNSAIDVHFDGRFRRIDVVRGNALFDVGKDARRPMLVRVDGHVLQDIGTVFDVKRSSAGDTLTVISGRVRVLNAPDVMLTNGDIALSHGDAVADLTAGEQISFNAGHVGVAKPVQLAAVTAWLPPDIRFQHETIGNVARRFNAYTRKPLVIENPDIAEERISGIFHADNPQAFAAYLATLPDVRVVEEADRVRVVAANQTATKPDRL